MATYFLAGVYGVGKSTVANKITRITGIQNYSAGDLISSVNGEKYGANKLVADKDKNQDILTVCVEELLQSQEEIILAGHFCIVNKMGQVDPLPEKTFENLHIKKIILLESDVETIVSHLAGRDSKLYSPKLILDMIICEREMAETVAHKLGCPLVRYKMKYSSEDASQLIKEIC